MAKDTPHDAEQHVWGFEGLDCINLPRGEARLSNALWSVLNMEWEGEAVWSRYGYKEHLGTPIAAGENVSQIYQLRLADTSNYELAFCSNKLYRIMRLPEVVGAMTAVELHTFNSAPHWRPAFCTYKDMAIICCNTDVPHYYDPINATPVGNLITTYPTSHSLTTFFPDVCCQQQSRLFLAMDKTLYWSPIDACADFQTSVSTDDAGFQPFDCKGRIVELIPWHESEIIVLTDRGERFRYILDKADQTTFYIKSLPFGKGAVKDSGQAIGDTVLFGDRSGAHNLTQEQFLGDLRSLEISRNIRPIFSGGRLSNAPFKLHGTYSVNWCSVDFHSKSQYWLAVSSGRTDQNNYVLVFHYAYDPMRISIFKFYDPITALASVLDDMDRERILIGSTSGKIFLYGLEHPSDNGNAYSKYFSFLVDFKNPARVDKFRQAVVHLVETGNFDLELTLWADFKNSVSDSNTISCIKDSAYLGAFTLGTHRLGRRELFQEWKGFNMSGRVFELRIKNDDVNCYFGVQGVDCFGEKTRYLQGT